MVINKTKIIATIGPATRTRPMLKKLMLAGVDVIRLNCSHGTQREHAEVIQSIRALSGEMNKPVGILIDLQGPKIRTGLLKGGAPVCLKTNGIVRITSRNCAGTAEVISTIYKHLAKDVAVGDTILIDDGRIRLKVLSKKGDTVTCKIVHGGILKEHKGINLPGVKVSSPSLTDKDRNDLLFGIQQKVDFVALSFVRTADDVKKVQALIKSLKADIPVIAKIEKPEAVDNFDEILSVAQGIMVARGDLGVELNPEAVPTIQKQIIHKAMHANKPVITATQMLETMSENPIPTRAEASDVANAIFDGTDAVMLSGETATGKYPVETVRMMEKIIAEAERSPFMRYDIDFDKDPNDLIPHAVAQSCVRILHEVNAVAVVNFSWSGKTAKLISKQRPPSPVYVFTPFQKNYRRLALVWGITPFLIRPVKDAKRLIAAGEKILVKHNCVKRDDLVVIVTGLALKSGSTNLIKIHRIGRED